MRSFIRIVMESIPVQSFVRIVMEIIPVWPFVRIVREIIPVWSFVRIIMESYRIISHSKMNCPLLVVMKSLNERIFCKANLLSQ